MEVGIVLLFIIHMAAVGAVPVGVLQIQVVQGRGGGLECAWGALRDSANRYGGMEGGLLWHTLEEVGELLRADD